MRIHDEPFKRSLTLSDAYRILERFIEQYNARGESSTVALLSDIGLAPDGYSCDPAQLEDFLDCANSVLGQVSGGVTP